MGQFIKVTTRAEFEELEGRKLVEVGGLKIAICNLGGSPHRADSLPCNCLRRAPLDSGVEAQGSFPCRIFCVVCSDSPRVSVARFNRAGFVSQRTQKKSRAEKTPSQLRPARAAWPGGRA